jgi:HSP20 family protein
VQDWGPALDVWETDSDVVYAFDLPGIPQDKISVEFEDGALTVSAERSREHTVERDEFYRYERRFGSFSRTIGLPQGVTEDQINAEYRDGVLELRVAKPEQQSPRRMKPQPGANLAPNGSPHHGEFPIGDRGLRRPVRVYRRCRTRESNVEAADSEWCAWHRPTRRK